MFVNKSSKVDSASSSSVNTMNPDIVQLSLTLQQVSSQLNLMLSQQHLQQKCSDRSTDSREDFVDLPASIYPEQQGRGCHHTSPIQPNLFKSTSHMLPTCAHPRHPNCQQKVIVPLSASTSSSLLSPMSPPIGCLPDPVPYHHKYHQHYHYSHPQCLSSHANTFQQHSCLHSKPYLCQEQQQQHCHQQYYHRYANQPIYNMNNNPRSIHTTPETPIETKTSRCSMSPPPPQAPIATSALEPIENTQLASSPITVYSSLRTTQSSNTPVPTSKNELSCDVKDDLTPCKDLTWTDIYRQEQTVQPAPNKTKVKKSKTNKDHLLRNWWVHGKTKWHQFRNKSVSPHV